MLLLFSSASFSPLELIAVFLLLLLVFFVFINIIYLQVYCHLSTYPLKVFIPINFAFMKKILESFFSLLHEPVAVHCQFSSQDLSLHLFLVFDLLFLVFQVFLVLVCVFILLEEIIWQLPKKRYRGGKFIENVFLSLILD